MHLFLHGHALGVIHLVVVLKCHCDSICQQGDQLFVLAVFSQCQIGGFGHGCNGADKSVLPFLRPYILSFHSSRKLAPDWGFHFRGSQTLDILRTRMFVQFGLELLVPHLFWQKIIENLAHSNNGYCFVDSTFTAYKVVFLWTILSMNRYDT